MKKHGHKVGCGHKRKPGGKLFGNINSLFGRGLTLKRGGGRRKKGGFIGDLFNIVSQTALRKMGF